MVNLGAFLLSKPPAAGGAAPPPAPGSHNLPRLSPSPAGDGAPSGAAAEEAPSPSSPVRSSSKLAVSGLPRYASRSEAAGPYNAKQLARTAPKHIVLDFSFLQLTSMDEVRGREPRAGVVFQRRAAPKPSSDNQRVNRAEPRKEGVSADGTTWDFGDSDKRGKTEKTRDGYFVVRAGEETYAFKDEEELEQQQRLMQRENQRYTLDENGNLVERKITAKELAAMHALDLTTRRYHCSQLKLNNNLLTTSGLASFLSVVSTMTINPFEQLTILDLSFNKLTGTPSLEGLPLTTLLLHGNAIESLHEVTKLQALHATLRKLTLNGNPIQDRVAKFKWAVLYELPFLQHFDDVRVTDKDRERIAVFEELFVAAKKRGSTRKFLPPIASAQATAPSP